MKPNFRVAISGEYTTNGMLFRLYYPKARVIYMNFLDIEDAVKSGMVDAGVLIHESILDFDETLELRRRCGIFGLSCGGGAFPSLLGVWTIS